MKVKHAVLGLTVTFTIALTIFSLSIGRSLDSVFNPVKASSQSFTFDRTTEVHDNGNGYSYTVDRGPGADDDIYMELTFYHSSEPYYMERTTPHHFGKHDSEDDYFLFCDDLQKDEGFKLIIGLNNITSFSFRWYLSDNDDDNACDVTWRATTYPVESIIEHVWERVNYSETTTATAGQEGYASFSRSDITYTDDPVNYIYIECKYNRYESTFRLRSITAEWSC